jgi:L-fuconolactonase
MVNRRQFLSAASAAWLTGGAGSVLKADPIFTAVPLIDSHVHVFQADPAFPFAPGAHPPPQHAPVETLLELMKANGVSRTVLIQIIHYKWDNGYLASVLKRYPGTFHGVCRVNPEDSSAPDHLAALTQQGFHGVRLSPAATPDGDWIRGPLMAPLWRRCVALKVPMTLLTPVSRLPEIVPLIEANPELDVVIDHMAECPLDRPEQLKILLNLARYPRVYVKISGLWDVSRMPYPYPDAQTQLQRLRDAFGAERLMWATNWPVSLQQLPYGKAVELYRGQLPFLNNAEREDILYRTVQRLWPFDLAAAV